MKFTRLTCVAIVPACWSLTLQAGTGHPVDWRLADLTCRGFGPTARRRRSSGQPNSLAVIKTAGGARPPPLAAARRPRAPPLRI